MNQILTTYEVALQLKVSAGYVRRLLLEGRIRGRLAPVSKRRSIWLIPSREMKRYQQSLA